MKRIFFSLLAAFAVCASPAQIPMPGWYFSDILEAQCGVEHYTCEKFDFSRFPARRNISEFLHMQDTVEFKKHIYDVAVCDAGKVVGMLRFQDAAQVSRRDTVTFVSAANERLQVVACAYLAPDAPDSEVTRAVDSLQGLDTFSAGMDILPANQDDLPYALQYLFARRGIDTSPMLGWRTLLRGDMRKPLTGCCCDRVREMKIGSDIERFARKAKFSEEYLYMLENPDSQRNPIAFFWCDGKFWMKIGMAQYMSYDSVISVWRHYKKADRIVAYKLKDKFR